MKRLILSITIALFLSGSSLFFASCDNSKTDNKQATEQHKHTENDMDEQDHQLYACPMHSEVTGNKDDKCPKCGMKLTEPVKNDEHM